ncbi:MAG: tRNA pseudouridine(38-40) synthase TruA [Acidobacteria bacterium]|nr:MAG: tRNA pseudouridine(38-40) synthase TruA [Acidobacteriota bacterium]
MTVRVPAASCRVALRLAYDGSGFSGWQRQPGRPTVQGEVERAVARLYGLPPGAVPVQGAGRTDAGVHALAQVAAFAPPAARPLAELARGLARLLPSAVRLTGIAEMPADFHPRRDAALKEYRYRIAHGRVVLPFEAPWTWGIRDRLDVAAMRSAAEGLVGRRDFAAVAAAGGAARGTVRTLHRLEAIERGEGSLEIVAAADGFLYRMVRNLVGLLVAVGTGRLGPDEAAARVAGGDRRALPPPAPARGLALAEVRYDPPVDWKAVPP